MTSDVIGQAGTKPNPLEEVFTELFHSPQASKLLEASNMFQAVVPPLRLVICQSIGWMNRDRTQQAVRYRETDRLYGQGRHEELEGERDLLSVLIRANTSIDTAETHRLSEAEVVGQIPAFLVAGHEFGGGLGTLRALSKYCCSMHTPGGAMEELNSLPYLEQIVRETLRLYAPVVSLERMAMENDVLPLAKPYIDKTGKSHDSIPIHKGQIVHIPILAINTDEEIWGHDAAEFKPERWEKLPPSVTSLPGAWANLLTFWAGPHNWIGFRFSLVGMKALLFTLIRAFEFEMALPKSAVGRGRVGVLQRPTVLAYEATGSGFPLLVKPFKSQP
ncbi:cytochrome P450 [Mycena sanguinolenta]|nr:cytochrome P450 [Mycena sanguinolenta]